jgi:hypothetical protein
MPPHETEEDYLEECRSELRKKLHWLVEKGTPIYNNFTEFARGYLQGNRPKPALVAMKFIKDKGLRRI